MSSFAKEKRIETRNKINTQVENAYKLEAALQIFPVALTEKLVKNNKVCLCVVIATSFMKCDANCVLLTQ